MDEVKRRLETAFLTPMRDPELRQMYGRSLAGGMLLYGPPGCGKTFLARAIAGELGAGFHAIELADVLDMWMGSSERNLHEAFAKARRNAPCVLFLDEIDALGQSAPSSARTRRCAERYISCSPRWTQSRATTTACSSSAPPTTPGTWIQR